MANNDKLAKANIALRIKDDLSIEKNRNLIFIYCPQKVGSTTLVSSLRVSAASKMTILHVHNEGMLQTLYKLAPNVTILEIIRYNKSLGKNVYVIDVYRTPIEHKISLFFERVDTFHFNIAPLALIKMPMATIINRFLRLYPHIVDGDYFKETYKIPYPKQFDFNSKFMLVDNGDVKFIKLRLSDSASWATILTNLLGFHVTLFTDYETANKPVKDAFVAFKKAFLVPSPILDSLAHSKELMYYMSGPEIAEYITTWRIKSTATYVPAYTKDEFKLYQQIAQENKHFSEFQTQHYSDEGCICRDCSGKRANVLNELIKGNKSPGKIEHTGATNGGRGVPLIVGQGSSFHSPLTHRNAFNNHRRTVSVSSNSGSQSARAGIVVAPQSIRNGQRIQNVPTIKNDVPITVPMTAPMTAPNILNIGLESQPRMRIDIGSFPRRRPKKGI